MGLVCQSRDSTIVVVLDRDVKAMRTRGVWGPLPAGLTPGDLEDYLLVEGGDADQLLREAGIAVARLRSAAQQAGEDELWGKPYSPEDSRSSSDSDLEGEVDSYWNCDDIPVTVGARGFVAWDVPEGRDFRAIALHKGDSRLTREEFEALKVEAQKSREQRNQVTPPPASANAPRTGATLAPSEFVKLTLAYSERFKSAVPPSVEKAAALSGSGKQLHARVSQALQEGRPVPEWEERLSKACDEVANSPHPSWEARLDADAARLARGESTISVKRSRVPSFKMRTATDEDYEKLSGWTVSFGGRVPQKKEPQPTPTTTGKPPPKEPFTGIKPAAPDDPIYKKGWTIGQTRLSARPEHPKPGNKDETSQPESPKPSAEQPTKKQ